MIQTDTGDIIQEYNYYGNHIEREYTYWNPGTYYPVLSIVDTTGRSWSTSYGDVKITVSPAPMLRVDVAAPERGSVGEIILIGLSVEGGAPPYSGKLDFGDGTPPLTWDNVSSFPTVVNHVYNSPGTYQITFTVSDSKGNMDFDSATIVIEEVSPPPEVYLSYAEIEAMKYQFQITISGGEPPFKGSISYGDGASDSINTSDRTLFFTHEYSEPGSYTVEVTIADSLGRIDEYSIVIDVTAPPPPPPPPPTPPEWETMLAVAGVGVGGAIAAYLIYKYLKEKKRGEVT